MWMRAFPAHYLVATAALEDVERELYLDVLDTAFACASSGAGCVVVVCGEAAIDKTALSQRFPCPAPDHDHSRLAS